MSNDDQSRPDALDRLMKFTAGSKEWLEEFHRIRFEQGEAQLPGMLADHPEYADAGIFIHRELIEGYLDGMRDMSHWASMAHSPVMSLPMPAEPLKRPTTIPEPFEPRSEAWRIGWRWAMKKHYIQQDEEAQS